MQLNDPNEAGVTGGQQFCYPLYPPVARSHCLYLIKYNQHEELNYVLISSHVSLIKVVQSLYLGSFCEHFA